jgi:hypothetical protein
MANVVAVCKGWPSIPKIHVWQTSLSCIKKCEVRVREVDCDYWVVTVLQYRNGNVIFMIQNLLIQICAGRRFRGCKFANYC